MNLYYKGSNHPNQSTLPKSPQSSTDNTTPKTHNIGSSPENYIPDEGLIAAVNVAIMLGRPLLLTGEPGCGKTQLAYHIAWEMQELDEVLRFDTKSTSNARDLFYTYDAVAHFHAAQIRKATENSEQLSALKFITLNALGSAILHSQIKENLQALNLFQLLNEQAQNNYHPKHSIILIDEIDKAPRDFPNDLLNEIEDLYFTIPELGNQRVAINPDYKPVIIMTSNSEKHLPDAFLRRCVYYNIEFPNRSKIEEIVYRHLGEIKFKDKSILFTDAIKFFMKLREQTTGLRKKPSTAELLDWLWVLDYMEMDNQPLAEQKEIAQNTFSSLVKNHADTLIVEKQFKKHAEGD